ncbi:HigA family addiction module antitoxin [Longimicrobium terrae]|uniref:Addiction module HigA family antidote n=1 Tax=Longimicrobium terrae TaxID=1639882 RepID=A0A841GXY3_9BACT|nr:HigA family addiction module antitoxin [Longimicrobium terrae]MBB4636212.1 addiction module HigA family antidote [Longimicrobium terrae]MBB6070607.1 addiction module HigA family antidote [Longimicrobium terrae]NNC29592.1 HigA family addiction module antidote protein [Longimicrobium terrae]
MSTLYTHVYRNLPTHREPTHPGQMLLHEFLGPMGMTQAEFARRIGVSYVRLNEIVNARRGVTADTALRFARFLGTTADMWLGLQTAWDLYHAIHSSSAAEIEAIEPMQWESDPDEQAEVDAMAADRTSVPERRARL